MGSETIPPCKENIIHIHIDTPLELPGCQFKLLRESSLISSRAKEIHTRTEVPTNDRAIYTFNNKAVDYIPSLDGIVPQSFNKYLLANGAAYRARRRARLLATKTKKIVKIGKNGKRVVLRVKKTINPITKSLYTSKINRKRGGFGPGFSRGKNTIYTKSGEVRRSAVSSGAIGGVLGDGPLGENSDKPGDSLNCDVKN